MLDYRYLKAFVLTCKYESFSKASKELGIAQSAVSRQIKLLEEALKVELLLRSSKRIMLTQKGKELLKATINFEAHTNQIFESQDAPALKIGILEGILKNWFSNILIRYMREEKFKINVQSCDIDQMKHGLENGKFDIIFGTENIQSELISSLRLFDEKLVLISTFEINKKRLNDYKWIVFSENDHIFKLTKNKKIEYMEVNSLETMVKLVESGLGLAIVPDHYVHGKNNLIITEVPDLPKSQIFLSTLNYKKHPEKIEKLLKFLKD